MSVYGNRGWGNMSTHVRPCLGRRLSRGLTTISARIGIFSTTTMASRHTTDQGYAWVILAAVFFSAVFAFGGTKAFGVFYVEFLDLYEEGSGATAWIASFSMGLMLACGIVVNWLTQVFSVRSVMIAGGIIAALGHLASAYVTKMELLYLTYGLLTGIGRGLCFTPSLLMVNTYFVRRRALANGMAFAGSGIGSFVLPFVTRLLIDSYGLKGAFVVFSGLTLNLCVCGAAMRPLTRPKLSYPTCDNDPPGHGTETSATSRCITKADAISDSNQGLTVSSESDVLYDQMANSNPDSPANANNNPNDAPTTGNDKRASGEPGEILVEASELFPDNVKEQIAGKQNSADVRRFLSDSEASQRSGGIPIVDASGDKPPEVKNGSFTHFNTVNSDSGFEFNVNKQRLQDGEDYKAIETPTQEDAECENANVLIHGKGQTGDAIKSLLSVKCNGAAWDLDDKREYVHGVGRTIPIEVHALVNVQDSVGSGASLNQSLNTNGYLGYKVMEDSKPSPENKDVEIEIGNNLVSFGNLQKVEWSTGSESNKQSEGINYSNDRMQTTDPCCCSNMPQFDVSILTYPVFLIFESAFLLSTAGYLMHFTMLPAHAVHIGFSKPHADMLLSVIGLADVVGRISVGWFSDLMWISRDKLSACLLFLGALAALLIPLSRNFGVLCAYAAGVGFLPGSSSVVVFVLMTERLGVRMNPSVFGLHSTMFALPAFFGPPIAGWLKDYTGSWDTSFRLVGGCLLLSIIIILFIAPIVTRRYKQN